MIKIIEREPMLLVGFTDKFICITAPNPNGGEVIGNLWKNKFDYGQISKLPGCLGHPNWGVMWGDEVRANPDELNYLAGIPFSEMPELPEGLHAHEVPGGSYARITHKGPIDGIGISIHNLLKWMDENGYEHAGHDLELYDDRWINGGPDAEMDYLIHVRKR